MVEHNYNCDLEEAARLADVALVQMNTLLLLHTLFFFFLQNNLDYVDPQIANLLFEAGQSSTNIIYNI